jgi:hypothetical protein
VDIYHARKHLHALAATVAFIVTDPQQWLAERLDELDAGNIEAIIATAREYPLVGVKATDQDKALTYHPPGSGRLASLRGRGRSLGGHRVRTDPLHLLDARWRDPGRGPGLRGQANARPPDPRALASP